MEIFMIVRNDGEVPKMKVSEEVQRFKSLYSQGNPEDRYDIYLMYRERINKIREALRAKAKAEAESSDKKG